MNSISKFISRNILYLIGGFFIILGIILRVETSHPHIPYISIGVGVVIFIAGYVLRGRQIF